MFSEMAIKVENLSKCYEIYEQPSARLKQFIVPRLLNLAGLPSKKYYREFWALKDLSFEVKKGETVGIIGRNLLDDVDQTAGFDALLEYQDHKPFECVGEGRESRAAMAALAQRPEWREDALVARFANEIAPQLQAEELRIEPLLVLDEEQRIPAALWEQLRARFAA